MNTHPPALSCLIGAALCLVSPLLAAERAQLTTYARTHGKYERVPSHPESFVIVEGELNLTGVDDAYLENVPFAAISGVLADALTDGGFTSAPESQNADLLIVVHRGRTAPHEGIGMSTATTSDVSQDVVISPLGTPVIDRVNSGSPHTGITTGDNRVQVAKVLGFHERLSELHENRRLPAHQQRYRELLDEVSQQRYYLVIAAYDHRALQAGGRQVLLWETRLSVAAQGKSFADRFAAMLEAGSRYYGSNTPAGLDRRSIATSGSISRIRPKAVIPSISGMWMSRMTTA